MREKIIPWLLSSDEPWTRYRTRLDLLDLDPDDSDVIRDRKAMLSHPLVEDLITKCASWPGYPLKRHNDPNHPLHALAVLADFGLKRGDGGLEEVIDKVLSHQSPEGFFETQIQLYKRFGGLEGVHWTWMACDAIPLLYILIAFGLEKEEPVLKGIHYLLSISEENGWRCCASPLLGDFKGPGKREDPCPIINVYALKGLSLLSEFQKDPSVNRGIEALLHHWDIQTEKKYYMFGIGTDFRKLKYPCIWYDILHVADVLSRFPVTHLDSRFIEMLQVITDQEDQTGRYTSTSMYRAWKDWSFSDKKNPSPWLTFITYRILVRAGIKLN